MRDLESLFRKADFSRETNFKQELKNRLFAKNVVRFPGARALTEDEAEMVSAAGILIPEDPDKNKRF